MIIDTPPPFLSGKLHIGHYYQYSLIFLYNYYLGLSEEIRQGFDANGLPLELKSRELGVDLKELRKRYSEEMSVVLSKLLGSDTVFWSTKDLSYEKMIKNIINYLVSKDVIYIDSKPVPYCRNCDTILSKQETGLINLRKKTYCFKVASSNSSYEVMTTNPIFLSRVAFILKNPLDLRYQGLSEVSFNNTTLKVFEDSSVSLDKGTGLVATCFFSNKKDVQLINKYLPDYLDNKSFKTNLLSSEEVDQLITKGILIEGQEIDCNVEVHEERSSCMCEVRYQVQPQFFIRTKNFRDYFLQMLPSLPIKDEKHKNYLKKWVENLEDWCISRQYKNGTKIGLYYNLEKKEISSKKKKDLVLSSDVLDCWFESSLSFLYQKTIKKLPLSKLMRIQGYEISRTWLLYTYIMQYNLGYSIKDFEVLLTGLILNQNGKKFSKSNRDANINFKTLGALRLWVSSFLPSRTEKRITQEEITLFEDRAERLRLFFNGLVIKRDLPKEERVSEVVNLILGKLPYIDNILKVLKLKIIEVNDFDYLSLKKAINPFLNNTLL